ncbi:hypothetical protein Tco_0378407 [Tanacetum coccineum]
MVEVAKEVAEVAKEMAEVAKGVAEVAKEVVEVVKKVIKVVKVVVEVTEQMEVVVESPYFATLIAQQLKTLLPNIGNVRTMNNGRGGCSYEEFMACNPKDYDRKGGVIVYTHWIEKMESVQDMSGCGENQKVKYTANSFIDKGLTWWNSQVQTRGRVAVVCMTWEDFKILTREEFYPNNTMQKLETEFWCHAMIYAMVAATEPTTIQSVILKAGMLTDEVIRNGALNKVTEKRRNNGEPSRDGNARNDNKRSKTGRAFATITNRVRKGYTADSGALPKIVGWGLR